MRDKAATAAANVNTGSHRHVQSREQLPNVFRVNHQISYEVGLTKMLGVPHLATAATYCLSRVVEQTKLMPTLPTDLLMGHPVHCIECFVELETVAG